MNPERFFYYLVRDAQILDRRLYLLVTQEHLNLHQIPAVNPVILRCAASPQVVKEENLKLRSFEEEYNAIFR